VSRPRDSPPAFLPRTGGIGSPGLKDKGEGGRGDGGAGEGGEGGKGEGGGGRGGGGEAEKDGARVFGEVRLPQTRGILRLFSLRARRFPPPPLVAAPLSFFFLFSLPSDARLPSGCSYVHVSYREERKTRVLIRDRRGCSGSSRHYFTEDPDAASSCALIV